MFFKKATLPLIIVFVIGLLGFLQEYVAHPIAAKFIDEITNWLIILVGFGMFIGIYSLGHLHITRIRRRLAGWGYSIFVFIGAIFMIAVGLYNEGHGPGEVPNVKTWFDWGYDYIQIPCQATIFSILAFFMASAAFRTFRAKNLAATLLLIAAVIVMLGQVPIGEELGRRIFGDGRILPAVKDVIMNYPNLAAKRAILMGISLGVIAQSVRILFGIERSYLGGGD